MGNRNPQTYKLTDDKWVIIMTDDKWVMIILKITRTPSLYLHMFDHNAQVNYLEQWKTWPCGANKKKIGWQEKFKPFRDHY